MALTPQGVASGTAVEVEANTRAERHVVHGSDWENFGSYAVGGPAGPFNTFGGAVTGSWWQFRVPSGLALNHVYAVRRVACTWRCDAFGGASVFQVNLFVVRNTTANGTGGAQLTTTGANGKLRTSMNPQDFVVGGGDVRLQNVSNAALGAMTGTQDAQPIANFFYPPAVAEPPSPLLIPMFEARLGEHPLILCAGEGLNLTFTQGTLTDFAVGINLLYDELVVY